MNTDEQIALLKEKKGIDWNNDFSDGEKYGRFIYKEEIRQTNEELNLTYVRNIWTEHNAFVLNDEYNREKLLDIIRK